MTPLFLIMESLLPYTKLLDMEKEVFRCVHRKSSVNEGSLFWGSFEELEKSAGVTPGLLQTQSIISVLSMYIAFR